MKSSGVGLAGIGAADLTGALAGETTKRVFLQVIHTSVVEHFNSNDKNCDCLSRTSTHCRDGTGGYIQKRGTQQLLGDTETVITTNT